MANTYLNRVRLNAGGYDASGYYWGIGEPLYHWSFEAYPYESESGYVRGATRDAAKARVLAIFPYTNIKPEFYR